MPAPKDGLGRYGEELAAIHLVGDGLRLLARNWRCAQGELDIVAADGATLVVCEVKTRTSDRFGRPVEAVTPAKAARLRRLPAAASQAAASRRSRAALAWLAAAGGGYETVRFDVVGVLRPRTGAAVVEHLRGVL